MSAGRVALQRDGVRLVGLGRATTRIRKRKAGYACGQSRRAPHLSPRTRLLALQRASYPPKGVEGLCERGISGSFVNAYAPEDKGIPRRKDKKDVQVARSLHCCHRNGPVARRGRWNCVGCSSAWRLPGIRRVDGRLGAVVGPEPAAARTRHPGLDPVQRRARGLRQDAILRLVRLAR